MSYLDAGEIALMRDEVATTLPETVVITRAAGASDGMGGSTRTWSPAGTVNARVDPSWRIGDEREQGGRSIGVSNWVVVMAHDVDVQRSDRIVHQGRTLEVTEVRTPQSWELLTRAECVQL